METKLLAIGGYESACLVDFVASYIFEVTKNQFTDVLRRGIYRYGILLIFKGIKIMSEIRIKRDNIRSEVDEI